MFNKLELDNLFFKNKLPFFRDFRRHHLSQGFAVTSKVFFSKVEEEKFSNAIVVSKLEFKFTLKIWENRF